jgi:hypothetical protein
MIFYDFYLDVSYAVLRYEVHVLVRVPHYNWQLKTEKLPFQYISKINYSCVK